MALVTNSVFNGSLDDALYKLWAQFYDTPWLSLKKLLYVVLALQQIAYFFLVIDHMDWAAMLVVLAWVYMSTRDRSFFFMYLVFIVVSILFDVITLAEMPAFSKMTPGQLFGSWVWIVVFAFKPLIVCVMIGDYMLPPSLGGSRSVDEEAGDAMAYATNADPYERQEDDDDGDDDDGGDVKLKA